MEHPLLPDISHLSLDQLQSKISELYKSLAFVSRGGNGHLANQIRMTIESYQNVYSRKLAESMPKTSDGSDFDSLIDIS